MRVAGCRLPVTEVRRRQREAASISRRVTPATGHREPVALRALLVAVLMVIAEAASACPVCYGSPDDPMVKGVSNGVWVLLGLVGFVQIGFAAMFFSFWRRGRDLKRFRDSLRVIEGGGPKA